MIRFIGDMHGHYDKYLDIVSKANESDIPTVQVGDFGFSYTCLSNIDSDRNKFIGGNHDFYPILLNCPPPHYLGDYGVYSYDKSPPFFFVRGAYSIDKAWRVEGRDWFPEEELNTRQMLAAKKLYEKTKPEFVLTHDAPSVLLGKLYSPFGVIKTKTGEFLQCLYEQWQPSLWIFGHHHQKFDAVIGRTRFICIPEFGTVDVSRLTTGLPSVILKS